MLITLDYSKLHLSLLYPFRWHVLWMQHLLPHDFLEQNYFKLRPCWKTQKSSSNKKSTKKSKASEKYQPGIYQELTEQSYISRLYIYIQAQWPSHQRQSQIKVESQNFFSKIFLHPLAAHLISLFMGGPAAGYLLPSNTPQWQARFFHHRPPVKF